MIAGITLCTSLLGLFLVVPLLAAARKRPANAWLAAFVFAVSVLAMADYAASMQLYARHPNLLGLFDWPVMGLGAFYYLYVLSMSGAFRARQLWHLLPMLGWAGWLIHIRLAVPIDVQLNQLSHAVHAQFQPILLFFQLIVAGYAVASLRQLQRYRAALRDNYSNTAAHDLNWLRWLTIAMCVQFCLWLPVSLLGRAWWPVLDISRLAMLYLLGWYGLRQSAVFTPAEAHLAPASAPTAPSPTAEADPQPLQGEATAKYARSGMTDAAKTLIGQRLAQRMAAQKLHQDANLTLTDLADKIGTSPQLLSQYLNEVLGVSFFEYVNRARVEAVQALMQDPDHQHHTVLDLALMAGFNSKSAFNTSFKRVTGVTPSQWKKEAANAALPIGTDETRTAAGQTEAVVS